MSLDKFKIEQTAKNVLGHFDPEARMEVVIVDDGCSLNIETEFSGLLIGRRGETLEALQHVLRMMLAKEHGEFIPVMVDISGYRATREKEIQEMARALAEKVVNFGGVETLPPMNAYERRLAHLVLQEFDKIESESQGVDPDRKIIIKVKKG